ncbi:carboxypeptidase-like regulatory domain-containing protein [Mangrovibacterium lignilyticum]|uniref:carboxypeptidase-like regulatory domain-containing protein n=1 Tax=Mangrovibacterium lignilyticum TaxID=2668052 RepID=UPI0013D052D5|nr:carboxypeptidase-like regulatory domain-containing protein [Mangrovibacterium lignilyticum]
MKHILIIACLFLTITLQAQTKLIKGRIVDSNNQSGIAYTNIGIEGTFYGTASDADGFFELKIPDEFAGKMLFVSAVGYENQSYPVSELMQKEFARIALVEQTYSIEGIDVAAQSRVLFRVIRTAAEKVPDNYHAGPIGMKYHYLGKAILNDSTSEVREAIVEMTDQSGYSSPNLKDAYNNRNYKFTEVNKNFESLSFAEGQTGFDELIDQDIARQANTVFNEKLLNDYDLHLEGVSSYEGDSVWVISYKTAKPDVAHSGDYYATKMEGKLYILKTNYALVRHECMIEASKNNPQNRSLYTTGNAQQNVSYHFTTIYQKQGGMYLLSYMDQDKSFTNADGATISLSRKAALLDLEKYPQPISGRSYFEDTSYDEKFWNSFHTGKKL